MGEHLIDGEFQSDKYPQCPRGKVPLSTKDPMAQDLLWEYAQRRRAVDAAFSADLEEALRIKGYDGPSSWADDVVKAIDDLVEAKQQESTARAMGLHGNVGGDVEGARKKLRALLLRLSRREIQPTDRRFVTCASCSLRFAVDGHTECPVCSEPFGEGSEPTICGNQNNPEKLACELPAGHKTAHRHTYPNGLRGYPRAFMRW